MSTTSHSLPPQHVQVLVIGGGPGGSYAASVLAREGLHVAIFEAEKFPRYHIGESLIPSIRYHMRFIDAESSVAEYGFKRKPGAAVKFNQFKRDGYTDFLALGFDNNAWNVVRSEFDELLLNHSRSCGASVYELTKVTSVTFSDSDPSRPVSVNWTHTPGSTGGPAAKPITGSTTFSYLIDASGRAGIMSTKYLKNRFFNEALRNVAFWGYWTDVGSYGVGTSKEGAPLFEALTDESGWAWFIPLHNGTTSVGVVMNQKLYNEKTKRPMPPSPFAPSAALNPSGSSMVSNYLSNIGLAPDVVKLITASGRMIEGSVKSASDFSYSAPSYAGNHYRIIGDAAAFIDPFFSSGIHLALTSGLSAAATICASIRGDCSESEGANWHTSRVATSYTRFQIVVLSVYKQIRAQSSNILSEVDEDNFDRAFSFLRPVIQGGSDLGKRLSENELQKSLDFCINLFNPTDPAEQDRLSKIAEVRDGLLDAATPFVEPSVIEKILNELPSKFPASDGLNGQQPVDPEVIAQDKMILDKINARRLVRDEFSASALETESLAGYVMRMERGKLGLSKVSG